jgi:hypothetical protein
MATRWMQAKLAKMAQARKSAPRRVMVTVPCEVPTLDGAKVTLCEPGRYVAPEGKGKRRFDKTTGGNGRRLKMGYAYCWDVRTQETSWLIPRTPCGEG